VKSDESDNKGGLKRWGRPVSLILLVSGVILLFGYEPIANATGIPRLVFQLGSLGLLISALFIFGAVREAPPDRKTAYQDFLNKEDHKDDHKDDQEVK
jgi:hypothetical protein